MVANKIISGQFIKIIHRTIEIKFATRTEAWERTYLAKRVQHSFGKAIESADIPAKATTAILACGTCSFISGMDDWMLTRGLVKRCTQARRTRDHISQLSIKARRATTLVPSTSFLELNALDSKKWEGMEARCT